MQAFLALLILISSQIFFSNTRILTKNRQRGSAVKEQHADDMRLQLTVMCVISPTIKPVKEQHADDMRLQPPSLQRLLRDILVKEQHADDMRLQLQAQYVYGAKTWR